MARFDRYLLSQLMVFFGFFSLVLVMVYWINRAAVLFDQLIADGQSAAVFLEFTALSLPTVIRVVLPVAAFVAAVYVTNRLTSESELLIVQSSGFSNFRLARPVLVFGAIVGVLVTLLAHILVPISVERLTLRTDEISRNVTSRLLTEGTFLHPSPGLTFYLREITPQGELKDIFLSDARDPANHTTYTAKSALLVRDESGPKLVMFDGVAQILRPAGQRLFTTSFTDFAYDLSDLLKSGNPFQRSINALSTSELISGAPGLGFSPANIAFELHNRLSQPLVAIASALIGFAALMLGGFSRFGVWRQILGATLLLIILKVLESTVSDLTRTDASLWPLIYLPGVLGLVAAGIILWVSEHRGLFARSSKVAA